jgi:hypothetical protein
MLSKQRCPYTGIVNYFTKSDPFVSVGSVMKAGSSAQYQWRWYDATRTISGIAADMKTAELRIRSQYRMAVDGDVHTGASDETSKKLQH